jgi:hypothetical protein
METMENVVDEGDCDEAWEPLGQWLGVPLLLPSLRWR